MNKEEQVWEDNLKIASKIESEGTLNQNGGTSSEIKRGKGRSIELGFKGKRGVTKTGGKNLNL